jgi:hypothetical protein
VSTSSERRDGVGTTAGTVSYSERLYTPWWWYLVGLIVASLLAAEFHIAGYHLTDAIPWGTLLPLSVVIVWFIGAGKLEIVDVPNAAGDGREVRVRGARLPLSKVSGSVALDPETLRRVVGREGDPASHVSIRPWIGPGVQLWLDDPDSPCPYWVLSTRHPERFLKALRHGD